MSNELENLLRKVGRDLADAQFCRFFKVPEEMASTPCDFAGYTRNGRAIIIEAKQVNRTSLPIGKEPGLATHQWNELQDADRAGAVSLLIWQRGPLVTFLPPCLIKLYSSGRKSIPWLKSWTNPCTEEILFEAFAGFVQFSEALYVRPAPERVPHAISTN